MSERTRRYVAPSRIDVREILLPLRRGRLDPALRIDDDASVWWTTLTPDGAGSLVLRSRPVDGEVVATAWGAGAGWLLEQLPDLVGEGDDVDCFDPHRAGEPGRIVAKAWRRHRGWRMPRTGRAFDAIVAAVIEQKVTGKEAWHSWRTLLAQFGEPAPGPVPAGMHSVPAPGVWAQLPEWDLRRAGVTPQRIHTLRTVASTARAIERTLDSGPAEADAVLRALPGVGEWTSAEVRQRAHGHADAVSFGDFHVAKDVCWWLTGERGDDERLRLLLEPFAGHRFRVQRLMELEHAGAPRRGPRLAPSPHRFG